MGSERTSGLGDESARRRLDAGDASESPAYAGTSAESRVKMKTVAVLGGGPAGSFAAERLARAGLKTIIFDEKLAWEKPCGGGLTFKAYNTYPFLIQNDIPKKIITSTVVAAPRAGAARMQLEHPLVIYSRLDLNNMLLKRAEAAGTQVEKARVLGVERRSSGWALQT